MFKKILSLALVVMMLIGCVSVFTSCGEDDVFKVGFICLHDETSTYDKNVLDAAKATQQALGLEDSQVIIVKDIDESEECYNAAADLVDQGCDVIFANSFGHEDFMIQAAKKFPKVQFCHAAGTMAHTEELDNYHNAFASIYEGRYLTGVAAGLKLNEMIANGEITAAQAKMGYVGAFTFAEVISGYTSFYLGAKSVCPTVTMDVQFTGSWYDYDLEKNAANALIGRGCVLISQHADSMGAPTICEEKGVPNVSYNGSTQDDCPETYIISSKIDWTPYFVYICKAAKEGTEIATDWTGTIETGSVALTELNEDVAAAGTAATLEAVKAQLVAGTLHVFDINTFTVNGQKLTSYEADVDTDKDFTPDTEVISDGYFHESEKRAAPYFDIQIDGIYLVNMEFGD